MQALSSLKSSRPDDALVTANLLVSKFKLFSSRGKSGGAQALSDLASELGSTLRPVMDSPDFEPSDCSAALYNLALARFLARDVCGALRLLDRLEADSGDKGKTAPDSNDLEVRIRDLRVAGALSAQLSAKPNCTPQLEDLLLTPVEVAGGKGSNKETSGGSPNKNK